MEGETKREYGSGSIYQRKDGKWVAEINKKFIYGNSEVEVKRKLKAYKVELKKNDFVQIQRITVREYMDRWLYGVKVHELKLGYKSIFAYCMISGNLYQASHICFIADIFKSLLFSSDKNLFLCLTGLPGVNLRVRLSFDNLHE